ncbi:DUF6779 domain-containing protein [Gordonia humi]|uniref:DUF6779 domain-containing protein n=1 Tax=Gordonia humi TaxID=686429 RepID=UPI00361876C0
MTDEADSGKTRGTSSSAGQWAIALLVVLALVASLLMVFGGDLPWTATLAVIAALWAAVIGAVMVTKYRRQVDTAENRTRDQRLVYELQLEREIAARRQYESDVEASIRQEVAAESNHELNELKAQVLALRSSLEQLLGKSLPESQIAIGLERPRELGSGLAGASYVGVADDHAAAERDFATTAPQTGDGRHVPGEPTDSGRIEMTEIIPVVTDDPADEEPVVRPQPAPQQRFPQPPPMPQRPAPRFPAGPPTGPHQRAAFGAGAYEPPSGPFRQAPPRPPQGRPEHVEPPTGRTPTGRTPAGGSGTDRRRCARVGPSGQ